MSRPDLDRLNRELAILCDVELRWKLPAAPITRQLIADELRPLPDLIPLPPPWLEFHWPKSGEINCQAWWREVDRRGKADWSGPYL